MKHVKECRTPTSVAKQAVKDGVSHAQYSVWCKSNGFTPITAAAWNSLTIN